MGLKVKTCVDRSFEEGLGLFADEFIEKGTVVWAFNALFDRVLSTWAMESLGEHERVFVEMYCEKGDDVYYLNSDDARFIKHSDTPNIGYADNLIMVAIRDIHSDEEITKHYDERLANFAGDYKEVGSLVVFAPDTSDEEVPEPTLYDLGDMEGEWVSSTRKKS